MQATKMPRTTTMRADVSLQTTPLRLATPHAFGDIMIMIMIVMSNVKNMFSSLSDLKLTDICDVWHSYSTVNHLWWKLRLRLRKNLHQRKLRWKSKQSRRYLWNGGNYDADNDVWPDLLVEPLIQIRNQVLAKTPGAELWFFRQFRLGNQYLIREKSWENNL